jgi:hypothetical protein
MERMCKGAERCIERGKVEGGSGNGIGFVIGGAIGGAGPNEDWRRRGAHRR